MAASAEQEEVRQVGGTILSGIAGLNVRLAAVEGKLDALLMMLGAHR